jgi:hypothetical protein
MQNMETLLLRATLFVAAPNRKAGKRRQHGEDRRSKRRGVMHRITACTYPVTIVTLQRIFLCFLALLGAAAIWLALASSKLTRPYATIHYAHSGQPNSAALVPGGGTFYVTNLSNRTIALGGRFIEVRDGNAWHLDVNPVQYSELYYLGPFQSGYIVVGQLPALAPWRLHVWISSEAHGINAFPLWIRRYAHRRTWQMESRDLGWKIWNWPPFGRASMSTNYNRSFELISEEIN